MNYDAFIGFGIFVGISLLFSLLGYLIKCCGRVHLLAGYDEKMVRNKEGLAKWVGESLFSLSFVWLLTSFSFLFILDFIHYPMLFLALFTIFLSIRLCRGATTFYS
ncbi:DUF3784 domain-containing protein [Hymenobacter volaticus]|uniref:DUF3784 domain-containing protein n=1 Tax=Hymenobacter volaticus TaxID=2932254 RepID=UPI0035C95527